MPRYYLDFVHRDVLTKDPVGQWHPDLGSVKATAGKVLLSLARRMPISLEDMPEMAIEIRDSSGAGLGRCTLDGAIQEHLSRRKLPRQGS